MAAGELITDLLILEYEVKYFTQWLILYLQIDFIYLNFIIVYFLINYNLRTEDLARTG